MPGYPCVVRRRRTPAPPTPPPATTAPLAAAPAAPVATPEFPRYQPLGTDPPWGTAEQVTQRAMTPRVTYAITAIVAQEAPLSQRLLLQRLCALWQVARLSPSLKERFLSLLECAGARLVDSGGVPFVWEGTMDPAAYREFRVPGPEPESTRALDDVALEELANGAAAILKLQYGMPDEDLARETARLFGLARLAGPAKDRMLAALALLRQRPPAPTA